MKSPWWASFNRLSSSFCVLCHGTYNGFNSSGVCVDGVKGSSCWVPPFLVLGTMPSSPHTRVRFHSYTIETEAKNCIYGFSFSHHPQILSHFSLFSLTPATTLSLTPLISFNGHSQNLAILILHLLLVAACSLSAGLKKFL